MEDRLPIAVQLQYGQDNNAQDTEYGTVEEIRRVLLPPDLVAVPAYGELHGIDKGGGKLLGLGYVSDLSAGSPCQLRHGSPGPCQAGEQR